MIFSSSFSDYLYNKSKTPTRREHSWGKAIWGPMYRQTDGQTDGRTKSFIEVLCLRLKAGKVFTLDSTKRRMKSMQALWNPPPSRLLWGYGLWARPVSSDPLQPTTPWPLHFTFIPSISQHKSRVYSEFNKLYSKFNWLYSEFNWVYSKFNWAYSELLSILQV